MENNTNQTLANDSDQPKVSNDLVMGDNTPIRPEPKSKLKGKRLWLSFALVIVIGGLLAAGGYFFQRSRILEAKNNQLKSSNQNFSTMTKADQLDQASGDSSSDELGGIAKQVNYAVDQNGHLSKTQYASGDYAPFYILNKYTVHIPANLKMERDTSIDTNGTLQTYNDEGSEACDVVGIVTRVDSTIYSPNGSLQANGSSSTSARSIGCGAGGPAKVVYAKYQSVPGLDGQPYKYMEVAVIPCADNEANVNCKSNKFNPSEWEFFSGLVRYSDKQYKVGDAIDITDPVRSLYNREKLQVQFYVYCSADSINSNGCDHTGYKAGYQSLLADKNYQQLKNIILGMRSY